MRLVALKDLIVVAIEANNQIDLSIEHDQILQIPDDVEVHMNWSYALPPKSEVNRRWFFPLEHPENVQLEPAQVFVDDGNGNPVPVTE